MKYRLPWNVKPRIIGALQWALVAACMTLLTSCSTVQLGYNQGPTLAWWWLDRQIDFTAEQRPRVQAALQAWFDWHRATQLPAYADELQRLQKMAAGPVSGAQVCAQLAGWQQRARVALEQALPAAAEVVRTLTPAQINQLERHQAETLDDATREFVRPPPAERRRQGLERALERFEPYYGPLDEAQRQRLDAGLAASPFDPERWLAERRTRAQGLVRALRQWQAEQADAATVQAGLRRLAEEVIVSPRPAYADYQRRLTESNCALTAELHAGTSPAQRQRAVERLKRWEDDLRSLAAPRR
ncbi:DUF6279 family lipoprotein [Aquabacterium sp. OR-4]|uniref:DUF6279 family lipoprotein n=1 Tax=Aquabacterium sp. OR-4 TaxID=2978127 RepID=UPI0028C771D9|nr:DUF6279 family lipoprotein [Aquabacterium sp. OR-4]MDT7837417.1 DUF6279 family lipoprotein [Aquabacterium sp. OR-4]